MGLDNGIILKRESDNEELEVAYFRKYYNLRDDVMNYLEDKYYRNCENEEILLDVDDLDWFIEKIHEIDNPEDFHISCYGVWEWDNQVHSMLLQYITNLKTAKKNWQKENIPVIGMIVFKTKI